MNRRMVLISTVVWMLLLLAAAVSATHIVETARKMGLHDWQAYTTPALIDLVAVVGKLSMAPMFSPAFRRSGFRLLMVGATLSLACNVYAGQNIGERAFGVLVGGAFMLLQHHATKAGRSAIVEPVKAVDEATKAARSARARKAAETRRRNQAAKQRKPRTPRTRKTDGQVEQLEIAFAAESAPVSPAA